MNFVRNAAGVLLTQAVRIPLGVGTTVVLARFLSVDDRGLYAMVAGIAGIGSLFLQLGWPAAAIYRIRSAGSPPARVAAAGLAVLLSVSLLAFLGGVALEPVLLREFLPGAPALVLFLALAIIPARLLGSFFGGISRALDRFFDQNAYNFLQNFGILAALSIALVALPGALLEAVIALAAVELALAVGFSAWVLRRTGLSRRVERAEVGSGLRFGLKSYAQSLAGRLHTRIDIFMLMYLLEDPEPVAFYTVASGVLRYLQMVPAAIGSALFPSLTGVRTERAARLAAVVSRHSAVWVALMAAPLFVVAPALLPWVYGESYASSVPALLVLLPGMFFFASHRPLAGYFTAINRHQINIVVQVAATLLNIGLNLWLIPRYGILGAAGASLVSYSTHAILLAIVFVRETRVPLRELFLIRRDDARPYRERLRGLLRRPPTQS